MPIYEFQCSRCNHIFEELVLSGFDEDVQCPKCHDKKVNRLISRTATRKSGTASPDVSSAPSCANSAFT